MPRTYPIAQYTAYPSRTYPVAQYIAQHTAHPSGGCPTAHGLQETALQLGTALQSPQHTQHTLASGRAYPRYPAYPASTAQTTRLHSQPTESITNSPEEANTEKKPSRGNLAEANQQNSKMGLYVVSANKGARGWVSRYFPYKLCCCCTELLLKENT